MSEAPGGLLTVRVESPEEGPPHVVVSGELDCSNAGELRVLVDELLETEPRQIVFNVAELSFMDSSGIAVLVHVANRCAVELHRPTHIVRRIVEVTGLAGILKMTE